MAYATPADVEISLGRDLSASETTQVTGLLERAELIITRRITDLTDRIADDAALEDVVVMVEADVVARVIRNPDGNRQESIDDYSYTRDPNVAAGYLYLTDEEWALLLTSPGTSTASEAFTITPYGEPGYSVEPDAWVTPTEQA